MADNSSSGGANPSDIMAIVEAMKALQALGGLQGQNYLQLGMNDKGMLIPRQREPGMTGNELGFAPSGLIFTGGSPYKPQTTGANIQNALFLVDQLVKSGIFNGVGKSGKGSTPVQNSVMLGQAPYGYAGGINLLGGLGGGSNGTGPF